MELNNNIYYSDPGFTPIPENKEIEPNVGGDYSSAIGMGTKTVSDSEIAAGKFNTTQEEPKVILSVGIGKSKEERENAITILENGEVYVKGIGGYDGTNLPASSIQNIIGEEVAETVPLEPGDAENSLVQEGSSAVAFGVNSTAFGTSSTNAKDRGITEESTLEAVIEEWSTSDPESDKFALTLGEASHIEGNNCLALGKNSHAEGNGTIAGDNSSHAEGTGSVASGKYAHAEGLETTASESYAHTEGKKTEATEESTHAQNYETKAKSRGSHAEGYKSQTSKSGYSSNTLSPKAQPSSSDEGWYNGASHAEGNATIAQGLGAHAEGEKTFANERATHAEGVNTVAGTTDSQPSAYNNDTEGRFSHAEGNGTWAKGSASHAEGRHTQALKKYDHAEGWGATANGIAAHAEGEDTQANAECSHAEGWQTRTSNDCEHAEGKYNKSNTNTISSVGIGTADNNRKNAFEILDNGLVFIHGVNGYDGTNIDTSSTGNSLQAGILNNDLTVDGSLFGWL